MLYQQHRGVSAQDHGPCDSLNRKVALQCRHWAGPGLHLSCAETIKLRRVAQVIVWVDRHQEDIYPAHQELESVSISIIIIMKTWLLTTADCEY